MNSASSPILSICIPAYGYEEGVRRIIEKLQPDARLEILVSEDVSVRALDLSDYARLPNLTHVVNSDAKGAVANWNRVLSSAKGDYLWLLHHDEEPVFKSDLRGLLDHLAEPNAPCLLLSRLELRDHVWQRGLRIDSIRKIFLRFPRLILIHNPIGSPSNCIVRRDCVGPFDGRLQWFVDVEWYYRLASKCKRVRLSGFGIKSHPYDGSITAGMRPNIFEIARNEIALVCDKHRFGYLFRKLWRLKVCIFDLIKRQIKR